MDSLAPQVHSSGPSPAALSLPPGAFGEAAHIRTSTRAPGGTLCEHYGLYLANAYPWQWFVTVTSRNRVAPEALIKRFRLAVSMTERTVLGRRPRRQDRIVWVMGEERHRSGNPHLHAILWQRHDLNRIARRNQFRDLLQDLSGWSKCEQPRSVEGATRYCAKYLAKEGELHFSETFGEHSTIRVGQ